MLPGMRVGRFVGAFEDICATTTLADQQAFGDQFGDCPTNRNFTDIANFSKIPVRGEGLASFAGDGLISAANGLEVSSTKGDSVTPASAPACTATGVCRVEGVVIRRLAQRRREWPPSGPARPGCSAPGRAPSAAFPGGTLHCQAVP